MSQRGALAIVVALTLLCRAAVVFMAAGRPIEDPDNYLPLARSIARGDGFALANRPTAYRPPLYPIVLAPVAFLNGDRLFAAVVMIHLAAGVGTSLATWWAARRWGLSINQAAFAGVVVACDPTLVVQCRSVMTETLAAFLIAFALAALADSHRLRSAIGGGVALGLAGLCRPSTLAGAALIVLAGVFFPPGAAWSRIQRSAIVAMVVLAMLSPWAIRNYAIFGEPIWTTTHGGYTLALANNPVYYREVLDAPGSAVWSGPGQKAWFDQISRATSGMSEPESDRWLRAEAIRTIRAEPREFAGAAVARLARFWGVAPSSAVYPMWLRAVSAAWTIPLWVLLILGLARAEMWTWPSVTALAIVLGLTLLHVVFWTDQRMRAPVVPAIALICAVAFRWNQSKRPPTGRSDIEGRPTR